MSGFPSLPPPPYSREQENICFLLDSEAAIATAKKLEQWVRVNTHTQTDANYSLLPQKEDLSRSPHPTPFGLTKEDCEVILEEGESEEGEVASAELDSDASFDSGTTMYEEDEM